MQFDISSFEEITAARILAATNWLRAHLPPTPLERIALLEGDVSAWAKFESDNPTGAFKVRGGLVYFRWLNATQPDVHTVVAATRGNHGQSVALAARQMGLQCRIVVPHGNSQTKNLAMQKLGAELVEHGLDFAEALEFAKTEANRTGAHFVPSFDWKLVLGVASYGYELFSAAPDVDAVFVPIGLGSGICATIAARNAVGIDADIIGVVAENAPVYAESFDVGRPIERTEIPETIADGVACRMVNPSSFDVIRRYAKSVVTVSEAAIERAIVQLHNCTGRRVEGAAAITLAACQQHCGQYANPAVIISGGNIDDAVLHRLLKNSAS